SPRSRNTGPLYKAFRRIAADRDKSVDLIDQSIRKPVRGGRPCLVAVDNKRQTRTRQPSSTPGERQQIDMPAYHQISLWPSKGMPKHGKRIGHPAPCGSAFIHDGFGDWFLDWIGDDSGQGIHALHQWTNVQGVEEITIEARNTAEATKAIG